MWPLYELTSTCESQFQVSSVIIRNLPGQLTLFRIELLCQQNPSGIYFHFHYNCITYICLLIAHNLLHYFFVFEICYSVCDYKTRQSTNIWMKKLLGVSYQKQYLNSDCTPNSSRTRSRGKMSFISALVWLPIKVQPIT